MRIIKATTLSAYWTSHPETRSSLEHWILLTRASAWQTMLDVQEAFPKAKVLNAERARFEVAGGNYRLITAFKFVPQIAYFVFIGTHAEYDRIDAKTIWKY